MDEGLAVFARSREAGDVIIDELGGGGVVADNDEHGRNGDFFLRPEFEGFLVVAVKGVERSLKFDGQTQRIKACPTLPRPFLGIFLPMCSHSSR